MAVIRCLACETFIRSVRLPIHAKGTSGLGPGKA
jgi:hypothetical protein